MIWDAEVLRVDGNLYAYIRVQNEFTGNIRIRSEAIGD